jgi:hypothetical protein
MTTPRSIDEIIQEMNDLAKAQGKYLDKTFWEIPRQPGSLLDAPETPESKDRIARLRARRLAREKRGMDPSSSQSGSDCNGDHTPVERQEKEGQETVSGSE